MAHVYHQRPGGVEDWRVGFWRCSELSRRWSGGCSGSGSGGCLGMGWVLLRCSVCSPSGECLAVRVGR
eukprot:14883111-Alexandrium_andersonii.AAC.1